MRFLATVGLLLGTVCIARAQVNAPTLMIDKGNAAQDLSATTAARAELVNSLAVADTLSQPAAKPANALGAPVVVTALAVPVDSSDPAPPSPKPRFIFGGRDDYRWELGFGVTWFRFQSSPFDARLRPPDFPKRARQACNLRRWPQDRLAAKTMGALAARDFWRRSRTAAGHGLRPQHLLHTGRWWRRLPLEPSLVFPVGGRLRAHRVLQAVAKQLPVGGWIRFSLLELRARNSNGVT